MKNNKIDYGSERKTIHVKVKEPKVKVETNIFDEEEIHENCTVQILRNSITGETSVGWYENE